MVSIAMPVLDLMTTKHASTNAEILKATRKFIRFITICGHDPVRYRSPPP